MNLEEDFIELLTNERSKRNLTIPEKK
ncbi:sporulation histidine kinase inhibitor Sda [Oceanobacillus bengalensis]|uniref:Sporulation histidine kinase inhibitor Sda n=1 Tax=Oceanobacillus bengalensis TaxID=1435466 RepID=A0A494Z513_9BACI|nr:sporulation histidine kinase inhibitor Sda [Oceanobacillus bengalensis]